MSTGCTRSSARPAPATNASTAGTSSAATTGPSEASSSAQAAEASCCSSPRTARLCAKPWRPKACAKSASPSITKAPRCWRGIRGLKDDEGEQLRGTAGALRLALAEGVLDESFFVLYGDSFLPIDFTPVWRAFESGSAPAGRAQALMAVL